MVMPSPPTKEMKFKEKAGISDEYNCDFLSMSEPKPPPPPTDKMEYTETPGIDDIPCFEEEDVDFFQPIPSDFAVEGPFGDDCSTCGKKGGHHVDDLEKGKCPAKMFFPSPPKRFRSRSWDDGTWVRIGNIWDRKFPSDLKKMFTAFGTVNKVCIPLYPKENNPSRKRSGGFGFGFGFVNFVKKSDAEKAVAKLHLLRYKHNTIGVDLVGPKGRPPQSSTI